MFFRPRSFLFALFSFPLPSLFWKGPILFLSIIRVVFVPTSGTNEFLLLLDYESQFTDLRFRYPLFGNTFALILSQQVLQRMSTMDIWNQTSLTHWGYFSSLGVSRITWSEPFLFPILRPGDSPYSSIIWKVVQQCRLVHICRLVSNRFPCDQHAQITGDTQFVPRPSVWFSFNTPSQ